MKRRETIRSSLYRPQADDKETTNTHSSIGCTLPFDLVKSVDGQLCDVPPETRCSKSELVQERAWTGGTADVHFLC